MRRMLMAFALATVLAITLIACGGETASDSTGASPAPADTQAAPAETSTPSETAPDAAALFADNCSGCHGADGSGGSGPDLRGEDDAGGVKSQIESGGGAMPAFSGQLSPDQIEALAEYVTTELQ